MTGHACEVCRPTRWEPARQFARRAPQPMPATTVSFRRGLWRTLSAPARPAGRLTRPQATSWAAAVRRAAQ